MATERLEADAAFPSVSALPRTVSWRSPVLVAVGGALLVTASLGPMAAELGNVSVLVWVLAAAVGALQCALIAELASRFPGRAGGTSQYAYRALRDGSPTLGALSSWSYWVGWTPGIAVNLVLAAEYLKVLWPGAATLPLALTIGVSLYALNSLGLRFSLRISSLVAVVAIVPLGLLVLGPVLRPSVLHGGNLLPLSLPSSSGGGGVLATLGLAFKWTFVAAWAAYGAEMASTLCAEVRDCTCQIKRTMAWSAAACLTAFALVPIALIAMVGASGLEGDSVASFLPAAQALFGDAGREVVAAMLATALILGAQAFILSSSRTVYQMARDQHLPNVFARVNRHGVPVGSMVCDAAVIGLMLLMFGAHVVDLVAAANVGYLIVFVLMPIAYIRLHRRADGEAEGLRLSERFVAVAVGLALFNLAVLVIGGLQWGPEVMLVGLGLSLAIVPVSLLARLRSSRARRGVPVTLAGTRAGPA